MSNTQHPEPKLETAPFELLNKYRLRKGYTERKTAHEICAGDEKKIAYDNLIRLYERFDESTILRMISGNRTLEARNIKRNTLQGRFIQAATHMADNEGRTVESYRDRFNVRRQNHGLRPLPRSYFYKIIPSHLNSANPIPRDGYSASSLRRRGIARGITRGPVRTASRPPSRNDSRYSASSLSATAARLREPARKNSE